ncbi:oxygen-insensitive NAD(P)H nitroreductase [Polaribacter sp. Q13]|uniref:oxygen-insensitive NAD(P)H nitroreductase n=1 Tax=Polaribacter sp. Q13 TaxID=2806551 RepID=UPI00193AF9F8|nr:oxygen-insensitive NAD(P)H nitroreductase [Polaribacter sp. Q13]QVY66339.1 oxygen-insensitive NAD(P)H nitroreductase [Polaribacter sp. Q13]
MDIINALKNRYSVKKFDPSKTISEEDFEKVKTLLRFSPSSTNLQPWHFTIAHTKEGKERIAKGTEGFYHFNTPKVMDASHVIVFSARLDADADYMTKVLNQEDKDGRYAKEEFKIGVKAGRKLFADLHRYDLKDLPHWLDKQVYLNMGVLLLGVAALGIDAVPMEGVDVKALDKEFGLREKGYMPLAVVSLGYKADDDFNAKVPKSRLPEEDIITFV